MADAPKKAPADYDGRFGEQFDDEIDVGGVVKVVVGTALTCAVAMALTWGMVMYASRHAEEARPAPSPLPAANERRVPTGPLLQDDPEAELEALHKEMQALQEGYGWVDQASGVVRIPIDHAIDLVVERGETDAGAVGAENGPAEGAPGETDLPAGEQTVADAGGHG